MPSENTRPKLTWTEQGITTTSEYEIAIISKTQTLMKNQRLHITFKTIRIYGYAKQQFPALFRIEQKYQIFNVVPTQSNKVFSDFITTGF